MHICLMNNRGLSSLSFSRHLVALVMKNYKIKSFNLQDDIRRSLVQL